MLLHLNYVIAKCRENMDLLKNKWKGIKHEKNI